MMKGWKEYIADIVIEFIVIVVVITLITILGYKLKADRVARESNTTVETEEIYNG